MSAAQPERSGEVAGILETSFELGAGLGVAVLGTVLAAVHRTGLPVVPGLGPGERSTAVESFAVAEGFVAHVPSPTADAVLHAARQAYDRGFTALAMIAAVGLVVTAFMAAVLSRPRKAEEDSAGD
ncbi:hypothetical protein [Streptomyces sp. AC550_RSS872]|uniref:hypothetical protein n=1 Tax=Streptomyces sp. AC550_RSS872 TaxID=2823689 RepID=UPI001C274078|nr:hypothetical protein [Streptomyces sp. AC550_RSS872]